MKRGMEFSFAWLFAIVVGAVIIFLAIYVASNIVKTEREIGDSEIGREIGTLLTPVETDLEDLRISFIKLSEDTRIYSTCRDQGTFGIQEISVATKSRLGKEWEKPGRPVKFHNKYIFSDKYIEGKRIEILTAPLKLPFEIGEVSVLWSDKNSYCFVNPTSEIENNMKNRTGITIADDINECSDESKKVCFGSGVCDIEVDTNAKSVRKDKKTVYYEDSLIYGAIFSDVDIYECQTKRMMKRAGELSSLYIGKIDLIESQGCNSGLGDDLLLYNRIIYELNSSIQLEQISTLARDMERINENAECKIF